MIENVRIANELRKLSKLCQLAGEISFKARAYVAAAEQLDRMNTSVLETDLRAINGIGSSIASKITQIATTGTCEKIDRLMAKYGGLLEILEIPGIGPKTSQNLCRNGVKTLDQLREQIKAGIITDKRILEGVKTGPEVRIPLSEARAIAAIICKRILDADPNPTLSVAGSLRRQKASVGDIDIVVSSNKDASDVIKSALDVVVENGTSKISGTVNGCHVDIRIAKTSCFGSMLLYLTGSRVMNIEMRKIAMAQGCVLNEHGLWNGNNRLAGDTEQEIFDALGMKWIEPEERDL